MAERAVAERNVEAAGPRSNASASRSAAGRTRAFRRQVSGPDFEKPPQDVRRDQPPIEQRRQALAQPALAQLDEHHRDVGIGLRQVTADPERPIERFADEPRNLGLVREVEPGRDAGFERKLADERQAERVDGGDGDVAQPLAQLFPARADSWDVRLASFSRSTIRCRISAAAFRVNVMARMCSGSTPASSRFT